MHFISLNWDTQNCGKHLKPELSLLAFMTWAGGAHRNVQDILISNVLIVKSIFIFKCTQNTTFNISHCWIWCVIYLLSLKIKLQVYLPSNKSHRRVQELPGLIPKSHHSHQFTQPGVCCLPWDFPEVKALLTVSKATRKSSLAKCLSEIYQTHRKLLSSFQHSSQPLSQGEAEGRVSSTHRGKPSVGEWSLVHQYWDWKGRRWKRTMKPLSVKALSEHTAFSYSAYSCSTR